MLDYLPMLGRVSIFSGLDEGQILTALRCFGAHTKRYQGGEMVFAEGGRADFVGVLLEGELKIQQTDYEGNANIISQVFPAELIGGAAAFSTDKRLPFDVVCTCDCVLLCIATQNLLRQCSSACQFHTLIINNLLTTLADKNTQLTNKIDILTRRTTREKVLAFLHARSKRVAGKRFAVNLTRSQMADYLSVNRSALIRELSAMRKQGAIGFEGNIFWFID